jgi:Mobilization protein NikA
MSDEQDRATYYEAHKDDPEEWGEGLPAKQRRRLASMFSVRLSPSEAAEVRAAAERRGVSVSAFLRAAALKEALSTPVGPLAFVSSEASPHVSAREAETQVTVVVAPVGADLEKLGDTHRFEILSSP